MILFFVFILLITGSYGKTSVSVDFIDAGNNITLYPKDNISLTEPMLITHEEGEEYLTTPQREKQIPLQKNDTGSAGKAVFEFETKKKGVFSLYGITKWSRQESNSFWVKINDKPWEVLGNTDKLNKWIPVTTGKEYALKPGKHTLKLKERENLSKLKSFVLTELPHKSRALPDFKFKSIVFDTSGMFLFPKVSFPTINEEKDHCLFYVTPLIFKTDSVRMTIYSPEGGILFNGHIKKSKLARVNVNNPIPGEYQIRIGNKHGLWKAFDTKLSYKHPRIMLTDKRLEELKIIHENDKLLQRYVRDALERADGFLDSAELERIIIGPRLLRVSRECLKRIYALGFAWRWTGQEKYAKAAEKNLLAVCAFEDWNPSHFLDVAEMTHAVAIGYDWLFNYFNDDIKERIRLGLLKHGVKTAAEKIYSTANWVDEAENNWNQVCNSSILMGALAVAETNPEYARFLVTNSIEKLPLAMKRYSPDGAWIEGPDYWHYATRYTAYGLQTLKTSLGNDYGLSGIEGFSETGYFPIHTAGPKGLYFNYADCGENTRRRPMSCMFFLAQNFNNNLFSNNEHNTLENFKASPEHVIWYYPFSPGKTVPAEKDRFFRGEVPVAAFRSDWNDTNALFVSIKAGANNIPHAHLDLGTFVLDALGERWITDLGSDDYNLPGYWVEKRWDYFRLNSASHNVPMINGSSQRVSAESKVIKTGLKDDEPFIVIDLSEPYTDGADKVQRGLKMIENRKAVIIQDEIETRDSSEILWGITTRAEIKTEGNSAVLSQNNKKLKISVLSPANPEITVESARQNPPQEINEGVKRLFIKLNKKGSQKIIVLISPEWKGTQVNKTAITPLMSW